MEPRSLEHVSTDDLIDELVSRSRTILVARRPLGHDPEYTAAVSMGVDGRKVVSEDERDRCLGLTFQAMLFVIPKPVDS